MAIPPRPLPRRRLVEEEEEDEDEFDFEPSHTVNFVYTRSTLYWRVEHMRQSTVPNVWTTRVSLASRANVSLEFVGFVTSLFANANRYYGLSPQEHQFVPASSSKADSQINEV